jgi:hypothetical protein
MIMADQSDDVAPIKRRNLRTWGLVLALVVAIALGAFYSVQSRNPDQSGTESLHARLDDLSLTGSRFSASIANDGVIEWDVDSIDISQGSISCFRLPKGVDPGGSETMRCTANGIKTGASYILVVSVKDVGSEEVYRASSYVVAMP